MRLIQALRRSLTSPTSAEDLDAGYQALLKNRWILFATILGTLQGLLDYFGVLGRLGMEDWDSIVTQYYLIFLVYVIGFWRYGWQRVKPLLFGRLSPRAAIIGGLLLGIILYWMSIPGIDHFSYPYSSGTSDRFSHPENPFMYTFDLIFELFAGNGCNLIVPLAETCIIQVGLQTFLNRYSPWLAILVTSIFFYLEHIGFSRTLDPSVHIAECTLAVLILALVLGRQYTRSILFVVFIYFVWNLFADMSYWRIDFSRSLFSDFPTY